MRKRHIVPLMIALSVIVGAVFFFCRNVSDPAAVCHEPVVRTVRLANRTITARQTEGPVPTVSVPQMPVRLSRRGTASFIVVSRDKATLPVRNRISACGARVTGVVPPYGIVVEADASSLEKIAADGSFLAVEGLSPEDKMSRSLKGVLAEGVRNVPVTVVPLHKDDSPEIEEMLVSSGAKIVKTCGSDCGSVRAQVSSGLLADFAGRGDVRWIERFVQPKFLADVAVRPGLLNVMSIHETYGLTGKGQYVTISDSGLDTGNVKTMLSDFRGRIGFIKTLDNCLNYDKVGHGTHVAGILAGNGETSGGWFKGIAHEANVNVYQCADADNAIWVLAPSSLFAIDASNPSYIHSGSWGGGTESAYSSFCLEFDRYFWSHPTMLGVFAAGNSGSIYSIYEPAGAKNVIAVGASESMRPYKGSDADNPAHVASFSSKGPMDDGRIKPDVCAPGSYIASVRSAQYSGTRLGLYPGFDRYMYDSGTSMATPFVSGCAVLIRQWLMDRRGFSAYGNSRPTAALIKAIITGGAHDMSLDSGAACGGAAPNSWQGWGRVNLGQSLYPTNASVMLVDRIAFSDGSAYAVKVTVTNSAPLAVQLVWTDYPGTEGAEKSLVNDLDLVVSNGTTAAVWYGNGVDGGDRINTVESVRIPAEEMSPGEYYVTVKGTSVIYDSVEGGAAALYVRGAFSDEVHDSWKSDARTEFKVRSYMLLSSNKGYRWKYFETAATKGQTLAFSVPTSVPGGLETIDVSSSGDRYSDENGKSKRMKVQRLGRIEIADSGAESGMPVTNAAGHMATEFSITVDRDKDILYRFYDEASTNASTTLPMWWYRRYVETDPISDVVRFTSVSPTSLEWIGGAGFARVLERTESLGAAADWREVHTCPPTPALTNVWLVPSEYSTNSFFRIR